VLLAPDTWDLYVSPASPPWRLPYAICRLPTARARRRVHPKQVISRPQFTILVYNGVMPAPNKTVRQTVSFPADMARQVRTLAKKRRLSANRIIVELVEEGIEAEKRKQKAFFALAERFRAATDPAEVARLGDELGRTVFGG